MGHMSAKIDHVTRLYLEGIRDGNPRQAITAYSGDRYTQHSTGVADGIEGFLAFFEPFMKRNPKREIEIVRAIEDGRHVFVHAYQRLNDGESEWVTTDLFDTDGQDLIVEHWDTITPFAHESVNGHTQVDGATDITDLDHTEENKKIVRAFLETMIRGGGALDRLPDFLSSESYVQHNPEIADGIDGLVDFSVRSLAAGTAMTYDEIVHLVGQGNFVATYSRAARGGEAYAAFDLFRLAGGRIVEHWDNWEKIAPPEDWNNSGKF